MLPYEETGPQTVCPCCLDTCDRPVIACESCYYEHASEADTMTIISSSVTARRGAFYAIGQKLRLAAASEIDEPSRGDVVNPFETASATTNICTQCGDTVYPSTIHTCSISRRESAAPWGRWPIVLVTLRPDAAKPGNVTTLARAVFETDTAVQAYVEKGAEGRNDDAWRAGLLDRMWIDDRGGWRTASEARADAIDAVRK